MMRNQTDVTPITSLVSILLLSLSGNVAHAESDNANLDSFFAMEFEKFNEAFENHIRQLDKCMEEMDGFEENGAELSFSGAECSKLEEMRADAQRLHSEVRAALEEYLHWISSLTGGTFKQFVERSDSAQSTLLGSMKTYSTRHKQVLARSERIMEKQVRRLSELEQRIREAQRRTGSSREGEVSRESGKSN
ncbi:MAG TPA: hypothetical protein VLS27_07080 [Gammaproteobacteria bacterium]|nr:hypothetical protein [Gammaproteobacteria bacterium]